MENQEVESVVVITEENEKPVKVKKEKTRTNRKAEETRNLILACLNKTDLKLQTQICNETGLNTKGVVSSTLRNLSENGTIIRERVKPTPQTKKAYGYRLV